MSELQVELGPRSYPVVVERDARARLAAHLASLRPSAVTFVTDANVAPLELGKLRDALTRENVGTAGAIVLPPGERTKNLVSLEVIYRSFLQAGLDRKSVVVALGGGVVGDLAGFAAATWMRGIRVIHAPTSLLAMVDSAIGGKTGIDLEGKNLVGAFHQPSGVFASLDALGTLPEREVRCGLGEVLKTAVLSGEPLFATLEREAARARAGDLAALEPIVFACAKHKAGVVARDEREDGERALLNLGHTLGHALEALGGFSGRLLHGEAVAIGLHFAARLSKRLGMLDESVVARMVALATSLNLPTTAENADASAVLELMRRDKKAQSGKLRFVLLRDIGNAEVVGGIDEAVVLEELGKFLGSATPRTPTVRDPLVEESRIRWKSQDPFWVVPIANRLEEIRHGQSVAWGLDVFRELLPALRPRSAEWPLTLVMELSESLRTKTPEQLAVRSREIWDAPSRDNVQTGISHLFGAASRHVDDAALGIAVAHAVDNLVVDEAFSETLFDRLVHLFEERLAPR